jgi:pimeloyl-ACP methyl ester carboxylesterase
MLDLNVVDKGSGDPPLLLVHGFTGSVLDWTDVLPGLAEQRRVIAYDHRGHGDSPNTGDLATYTLDQLVADLEDVVDELGLQSFHLLGHSMGGVVALRFVLAHPERVRSLILMDTMSAPSLRIPIEWIDATVALARNQGMSAVADRMIEASRVMAVVPPRDEVIDRMRIKLTQMDPEALAGLARSLRDFDSMTPRLGEINCPTTVLVGELDQPFREPSETMAASIPGSTLVVLGDAGHCPQEDRPDVWLAEIDAHLVRAR